MSNTSLMNDMMALSGEIAETKRELNQMRMYMPNAKDEIKRTAAKLSNLREKANRQLENYYRSAKK